jgi:uncharacterized membrane protein YhfC
LTARGAGGGAWLYLTYPLNAVLMPAPSLAVAAWLARARAVSWTLCAAGALVFLAAQAVRRPLNAGLARVLGRERLDARLLALTAGLTEETARYAALRWALPEVQAWPGALMLGAGHAGFEALLLALTAGLATVAMVRLRHSTRAWERVPAARRAAVRARLAAYWAAPAAAPLLGVVERVVALAVHLGGALLALQAVVRGSPAWLGAAVLLHAAVDAAALALAGRGARAAPR